MINFTSENMFCYLSGKYIAKLQVTICYNVHAVFTYCQLIHVCLTCSYVSLQLWPDGPEALGKGRRYSHFTWWITTSGERVLYREDFPYLMDIDIGPGMLLVYFLSVFLHESYCPCDNSVLLWCHFKHLILFFNHYSSSITGYFLFLIS